MKNDYLLLVRETLVCMRKEFSQEQINRKLKFTSNQIGRWESGHAKIDWSSFCDLAQATKCPLKEAVRKHIFFDGDISDQNAMVNAVTHFHTQKFLAEKLNLSKSFISRLIKGETQLSLDIFFALVELGPFTLTDFIAEITAPFVPASIEQEQERRRREKELHFREPWVAALLLYMRTHEYQKLPEHSDKYLAEKMGKTEADIKRVIQVLLDLDIITKKGTYYLPHNLHVNTGGTFEGGKAIRKYWLNHCLQELEKAQPGQNNFFGYKVFNVHTSDRAKFEEFYFRMNAELDSLIKSSGKTSEEVYLFSFQMLNLDQTSKKKN